MKIPKTEKEFVERLTAAFRDLHVALDLEFKDPEEPELPERIGAAIDHFAHDLGESEEQSSMLTFQEAPDAVSQGCAFAVYREAAARYNVLGELRDWLEHHSTEEHATPDAARACGAAVRFLDHSLKDERERLK